MRVDAFFIKISFRRVRTKVSIASALLHSQIYFCSAPTARQTNHPRFRRTRRAQWHGADKWGSKIDP